MKTNYVILKEEDVKSLRALISETEKRTLERENVLREIRKDLKKSNADLAKVIDENWKLFLELQALQMPHVVYNGNSKPTIVDWVKDPDGKFKLAKPIKSYRYTTDESITVVDGCFDGRITRDVADTKKEVIVFASGFAKEVPSLDEEGKTIPVIVKSDFVPKEKSTWGFTKVMIESFLAAADDLLETLQDEEPAK